MRHAVIVGAGIGGLSAAIALRQRGWQVTVCERASALEEVGAGIAIQPNALKALDTIGLGERLRKLSAMQGDVGMAQPSGRWLTRSHADVATKRFGDPTILLHRAVLVDLLRGALAEGSLGLGTTVEAVDADTGTVRIGAEELSADLIVAADGIHSRLRQVLFPTHPGPVYSGVTSWRVLSPALPTPVQPSETWGRGEVVGLGTLADGRIYCYATAVAAPGQHSVDEQAELVRRFGRWHAPIPQVLSAATDVLRTDILCLDQPLERFHAGRVALLGDAAHAMTPNLGQGACQAIEDAVVLAQFADQPDGLVRYSAERVPRTTMVARQSRRIGRMTQLSARPVVWLRDTGMRLGSRLGDDLLMRQLEPVLSWRPPDH